MYKLIPIITGFVTTVTSCTSEGASCSSCVGQSNQTSLCVWCYTESECARWVDGNPCNNISDVSFGRDQCECRPGLSQTCGDCTSKHSCVWLDDSELEVTVTVSTGQKKVVDFMTLNSGASCWAGNMFSGPTWDDWILETNHVQVHAHLHESNWSWAQCTINGAWMATLLVMVIVFLSLCLCFSMRLVVRKHWLEEQIDDPLLEAPLDQSNIGAVYMNAMIAPKFKAERSEKKKTFVD